MTDQFINRSALTENFTVLPNALLNDDRLTGEGLALMVYLLSKPSSWQLSPTNIRKRFKWGKDKAYKVINGLIECGYIVKEAQRDGGKYASFVYFVYDTPQISPFPEKPEAVKPEAVNQDTIKNRETIHISTIERTDSNKGDEWFDKFWAVVAHKEERKTSKAKFLRACKTTDPQVIIDAYKGQLAAHLASGDQAKYFKRPKTWLNGECWNDEYQPAETVITQNRYTNKVKGWLRTGYWHPEWGDPPDTPTAMIDAQAALKELTNG